MSADASRADPFGDLDLAGFEPKPAAPKKSPIEKHAIREVSEANNFPSRAAPPAKVSLSSTKTEPAKPKQRYHRTGRNVQFNIKTTQATIDRFIALSERNHWVLGETLENALDALERAKPQR